MLAPYENQKILGTGGSSYGCKDKFYGRAPSAVEYVMSRHIFWEMKSIWHDNWLIGWRLFDIVANHASLE